MRLIVRHSINPRWMCVGLGFMRVCHAQMSTDATISFDFPPFLCTVPTPNEINDRNIYEGASAARKNVWKNPARANETIKLKCEQTDERAF